MSNTKIKGTVSAVNSSNTVLVFGEVFTGSAVNALNTGSVVVNYMFEHPAVNG